MKKDYSKSLARPAFTIVELLIIIGVIAILAALTIVGYNGITSSADESAMKTELNQLANQIGLDFIDNRRYPENLSDLTDKNYDHIVYSYDNSSNPKYFCIMSIKENRIFHFSSENRVVEEGGCTITNLALNPRGISSVGFHPNDSVNHSTTYGVTVPPTPDGITSAIESQVVPGRESLFVLSVWNIDGLSNTSGVDRNISLWARVNAEGYHIEAAGMFEQEELPANEWVRVSSYRPALGNEHSWIGFKKDSGLAGSADRAWITGVMSVEGDRHYSFADGSSSGWAWGGAANSSYSSGPAKAN